MKKIIKTLLILVLALSTTQAYAINTDAMLQYNQGIDYYKVGKYDSAISSFKKAIDLDPDYIDAYYNLGSILEYLGQYEAALAVFQRVMVRQPNDYDSVYKAAWLSHKLGQDDKAKTYLSIIPKNYEKAQNVIDLMSVLSVNLSQQEPAQATEPKIEQTNSVYDNIQSPTGITTDINENVYVAEFTTNSIIKITPDNKKIIFVKSDKINGPIGLATDKYGNLYIANYNDNNVLKVSTYGEITPFIEDVQKPYSLYVVGDLLFVTSQGSNAVLRYKLSK